MEQKSMNTLFAPSERAGQEIIMEDYSLFPKDAPMFTILNSVPTGVIILNQERQIVFTNAAFLNLINKEKEKEVLGKRPGEVLNCTHAFESEGGCGTTEFCRTCGAVNSILIAQKGKENIQECRIIEKHEGNAFDLRINSAPLEFKNKNFVIFTVQDIQSEKRRKVFERIFFHDIMNTASSLKGIAETIEDVNDEEAAEFIEILGGLSDKLIDEINAQRELLSAENNDYKINPVGIYTESFLDEIIRYHSRSDAALNKKIIVEKDSVHSKFISDKTLLWRVISNMVKNALEASKDGQEVKIKCSSNDSEIIFYVNNPAYMERNIQLQVFQRSFSSKGTGRGLGTYSIKLLTERYLKGKVGFISDKEKGTTFFIRLPAEIKP